MEINQTAQVTNAVVEAYGIATEKRHEFLTPEHLLAGYLKDRDFWDVFERCGDAQELEKSLYAYLNSLDSVPEDQELAIDFSEQTKELFQTAGEAAMSAMAKTVQTHHIIYAYFHLEDSNARFHLENALDTSIPDFLNSLLRNSSENGDPEDNTPQDRWLRYFTSPDTDINLVGRKEEIGKIFRVLCRKTKSNVLLVGGRGVGKTAIVRAFAKTLESATPGSRQKRELPSKLQESAILELNVSTLLNGTQYRGDLEGRVQEIMNAVSEEGDMIIYVDELRSLGGMNKSDDGSKDILSLLIPYLKSSKVKFIISATPEDVKKLSSNDQYGVLSLFRQIDIEEPSDEEAQKILEGMIPSLAGYHGVKYMKGTAAHAVAMSRRYMADRCLPDKAADLLDEAGAYAESLKEPKVTNTLIDKALADICRIDVQATDEEVKDDLYNMEKRLGQKIFGQEKAIRQLSEAILMSKAGLLDSGKTVGNFLFVGPTGVGKTELSKALAQQLHVPLHRFDMSEYSEKHSVAKLIGSPAGYVGYDDGGILTDAIRRNPHCVLLLDEIEKAHEDIYNLLLQVMDYAVITDNKGRKVDFRNVVVIMTSNAGARYAHKASVGFHGKADAGAAMAKEVKSVFAPEFINRLTSVVVFNDLDEKMVGLILDDKIKKLQERLNARKIRLEITQEAYERLLKEGFSPEYGAREIERVLNSRLTPLLMREILFGKRKENFTAKVAADSEGLKIDTARP